MAVLGHHKSVNLATSFRQFGIDMRMEKSSGLQNFSENRMISQISGLKQYKLCGSRDASVMLF